MEYVYDVIAAYLDWHYEMPHYPRYRVTRRKVGSAASFEAAKAIIDDALRDEYIFADIHHFVVEKWPFGVYHGGNETLAEYSFDANGKPLESRDYPYYDGEFMGRKPDEYRFKEGDLCEVWSQGYVSLGIVLEIPPTDVRAAEIRALGGHLDSSDDCYVVLHYDEDQLISPHVESLGVFPVVHKVNPMIERRLRNLYQDYQTRPIRLAIADTTGEALLIQMLEELGLDAEVHKPQYMDCPFELVFPEGHPYGLSEKTVSIEQSTVHNHMDRVCATFQHLVGKKTSCRRYPLLTKNVDDKQNYYISGKREPQFGKKKRRNRYTVI